MRVFVRASQLSDNNGLQGVLECEIVKFDFLERKATLKLPDGHISTDLVCLGDTYCDEELEAPYKACKPNDIRVHDKAGTAILHEEYMVIVKDYELLSGGATFIKWSADGMENEIEILGTRINPKDYRTYDSVEEAMFYEEVRVHHQDGTVETKGGTIKDFTMDDEQQALMDEFHAVLSKMKDKGMTLVYNNSSMAFSVVAKGCKDIKLCAYDEDCAPDGYEPLHDGALHPVALDFEFINPECCYDLYFKKGE